MLVSAETSGSLGAVAKARWVRDPHGAGSPWHVDHLDDDGQFFEAAILAIQAALPAHQADLITQACTLEREAIATRAALMAEAQALVAQATTIGRTIGTRANWLLDQLGQPTDPGIACHPDEVQWLRPWQVENHAALAALKRLEGVNESTDVLTVSFS